MWYWWKWALFVPKRSDGSVVAVKSSGWPVAVLLWWFWLILVVLVRYKVFFVQTSAESLLSKQDECLYISGFWQKGVLEASLVSEWSAGRMSTSLLLGGLVAFAKVAEVRFNCFFFRRLSLIPIKTNITFVFSKKSSFNRRVGCSGEKRLRRRSLLTVGNPAVKKQGVVQFCCFFFRLFYLVVIIKRISLVFF